MTTIYTKLKEPFAAKDIEWRIAQKGAKDGKPWAKVLAYVTNRAIMERLDDVVGPQNWSNNFENIGGAFLCTLSLRIDGEWVSKQDGAQESQIEATKGGISGAMKRAAVQWGIGRYLYNLDGGFADVCQNGRYYSPQDSRNGVPAFKWNPPQLPTWALPAATTHTPAAPAITLAQAKRKIKSANNQVGLAKIAAEIKPDCEKWLSLDEYEELKQEIHDLNLNFRQEAGAA